MESYSAGEAICRRAASPCPNTECAVLSAGSSESVFSLMRTVSANSPPDAAGLLAKAVLPQDRQRTSVSNSDNTFFINVLLLKMRYFSCDIGA